MLVWCGMFRLLTSLVFLQQGRHKWCKHISFAKRSLLAGSPFASDEVRNAKMNRAQDISRHLKTSQDICLCLKHFETQELSNMLIQTKHDVQRG